MGDIAKRKDVERAARELADDIAAMRRQMAMQDGIIQRQAAEITVLRAAGDRLAEALERLYEGYAGDAVGALAAWREVAR